jgi:D-glycero-D-manno-heptose 1,7-bisphosphate phosphatase
MLLQAASDLQIDLSRSWFVGDILDDMEAGNRAGCHTILVDLGTESRPDAVIRSPTFIAKDTPTALNIINAVIAIESTVDLLYRPKTWAFPRNGVEEACNVRVEVG